MIPPAPRPYSNPPPTPHDRDTPTSTTDDNQQIKDDFSFENKEDNFLASSEGDEFERQLELKLMASTDDLDLQGMGSEYLDFLYKAFFANYWYFESLPALIQKWFINVIFFN